MSTKTTDNLTITSENCGGWFDDWIVKRGKKCVGVYASVTHIPRPIVRTLLKGIRRRSRATSQEVAFLLNFAEAKTRTNAEKRMLNPLLKR